MNDAGRRLSRRPPDATVLTFSLAGVNAAGFADPGTRAGDLVVDLACGTAVWQPAETGTVDRGGPRVGSA